MFTIGKFFNTVKYLKFTQIKYRGYYTLRSKIRKLTGFSYPLIKSASPVDLILQAGITTPPSYLGENSFRFLNISHSFDKIDWNWRDEGHLWTFNLNYFDFINQEDIHKDEAIRLIYDFIDKIETVSLVNGLAAYTISLRGMNWIKFLIRHGIRDKKIDDSLYAQYMILLDNLEYQFMANHLLENGFSLLFGAYYFNDEVLYVKAKEILKEQLSEQTLEDGANFELSPMYHQIILGRVLDCVNLMQSNEWKYDELMGIMEKKAEVMLGWINAISFKNGEIPLLNDSANGIAPMTEQLNSYADTLQISHPGLSTSTYLLKESGYRMIRKEKYEMAIDVANIGAAYNPAHVHSDTFTFELYVDGKPFIVDTGTSTYNKNSRRHIERSTFSHNTVVVGETNQSEVWGGFRVADRANIVELEEKEESIRAIHDGYQKHFKVMHQREFMTKDEVIKIIDKIIPETKTTMSIARLHFHPDVEVFLKDGHVIADGKKITFLGAVKVMLNYYQYAPEYNRLYESKVAEVEFYDNLECEILL
ncbi:alginate lyase family protein [Sulfurovum sp. AR]|uniref:alginate lyase family protein n=1 Tax=Sulfurovum sp. AR TaxID=1165841 RepID=UPI00025C47B7|nr:alginate lyase family protein [Sulfurovum sp. AR]EIF51215.1 prenyltransferase and squalene oxidase [Sulfurovum sp. AR]